MMQLLNPPTPDRTLLAANYDKLLHTLGSFTALLWLSRFAGLVIAVPTVLLLCVGKMTWNYTASSGYKPLGDWIANTCGFLLYLCLWMVK